MQQVSTAPGIPWRYRVSIFMTIRYGYTIKPRHGPYSYDSSILREDHIVVGEGWRRSRQVAGTRWPYRFLSHQRLSTWYGDIVHKWKPDVEHAWYCTVQRFPQLWPLINFEHDVDGPPRLHFSQQMQQLYQAFDRSSNRDINGIPVHSWAEIWEQFELHLVETVQRYIAKIKGCVAAPP